MRVHAGITAVDSPTRCRVLIGGFGLPGMRDLDFGRQFVGYAEALSWPDDVVVEDLSDAPHLVLHRLRELGPATVVFVGSVERGTGPPGAVRSYRLDLPQPDPRDVHLSLSEGVTGVGEFHHTLRVLRHWGGLPADTVIVEVEPADTSFGLGFSEQVGSSIEQIVETVRAEVGCPTGQDAASELSTAGLLSPTTPVEEEGEREAQPATVTGERPAINDLVEYAAVQEHVHDAVARFRRTLLPEPPQFAGLSVAARSRPFGKGLQTKGDWYDFVPLADGWFGLVMGDVAERGLEAAIAMSQLRSAVRVCALTAGLRPGEVVTGVDRVVTETGIGTASTLIYAAVNAASGEVRVTNAGHCPPLLVSGDGAGTFVERGLSARLGAGPGGSTARPEASVHLAPGSSLLVYTDGLLADEGQRDDQRQRLCFAAATGPPRAEEMCDHVMSCCLGGVRRSDDASLVVLRRSRASSQD